LEETKERRLSFLQGHFSNISQSLQRPWAVHHDLGDLSKDSISEPNRYQSNNQKTSPAEPSTPEQKQGNNEKHWPPKIKI
jgi:hypothetical protein